MVPNCTVELNKLMNELEVSELEVSPEPCEQKRFVARGYVVIDGFWFTLNPIVIISNHPKNYLIIFDTS